VFSRFDISLRPSGFPGGFQDLIGRFHMVLVDGTEIPIADLDDVIASKEAAGRPKDLQVLPILYRHGAGRMPKGDRRIGELSQSIGA
jgi:hypothetical protein